MQGLWKDKRKNFLKDKTNFLRKRYRKNLSEEKSLKLFNVSELNNWYKTIPLFEKVVTLKPVVRRVKAYYSYFLNFDDLKKCDNCPFRESEEKRCKTYDKLSYIKKEYSNYSDIAKYNSFFCKRDDIYIGAYYYEKSLTVYLNPITKKYINYFSQEIIDTNKYTLDFHNSKDLKDYSVSIETKEIYEKVIYNHSQDIDFVYGKPEETFKRVFRGRRKACASYANKLSRVKSKEYTSVITKDSSLYFDKEIKTHQYQKSVAWLID